MDIEYFKNQVMEELEGAKQYAKYCIEIKPMNLNWSKMFFDMSNAELEHASNLFKMFEEYMVTLEKSFQEMPDYINKMRSEVVDFYTEESAKVRYILSMYNNR